MSATRRRAYWGDLRLWYHARTYTEDMKRTGHATYPGVDRGEALQIGPSPSFVSRVEVTTFFAPTSAYTQAAYRAAVAAMLDALRERASIAQPGHPLVWVGDNDRSRALASGATAPYATTAPHGLTVGERVLIRALGVGDYMYGSVATTPGASTFTVTPLATGSAYAPAAGHDVLVAERVWPGAFFEAMPALAAGPKGDFYNAAAKYAFYGSRVGVYTATAVDLDLDLG